MKNLFAKALSFIKENPSILYSLVLVFLIPMAFFINTYLINLSYEEDINKITQRKAVLVEDIINDIIEEQINEDDKIQEAIDNLIAKDSEIIAVSVSKIKNQDGNFEIVASNNKELIGSQQANEVMQNTIAWNTPEGIAFLDKGDQGRFWKVTKMLKNNAQEKIGLISISLSLASTDVLINKTIRNSYWVLIITILIVLLFVSNQARLFGYALTITKLKEVDKMKDMFISMASHELRSPLGAIKGYVDFLKEKKEILADKDANHYVENISLSIERLNALVADML
jgi:K+-sensing histidine kinase KdpD